MAPAQHTHRQPRRRLGYWVALALLIHAELLLVLGVGAYFWVPRLPDVELASGGKGASESIDISTLDDETSRKILAELEKQEEKAKEEEVKKEQEQKEA